MTRRTAGPRSRGLWILLRPVLAVGLAGAAAAAIAHAAGTAPPASAPPRASSGRDTVTNFHWSGHVDADRWVRVRDLSGWVHVERSTGSDVEISARKSWRHGNPDVVRLTLDRTGASAGDVLVCALWGEDSQCDEHGYESHSHHHRWHDSDDDDVNVDFTIGVPAGIKVLASTVNGDVDVTGTTRDVDASSVNGRVAATSTGGPVEANSVNGSVDAEMSAVTDAASLRYSSVNGSVRVTLPADLKADIELSTINGSVRSDFPISVSGSLEPRNMHGTIGGGGIPVRIDTVNGSIELRKGS